MKSAALIAAVSLIAHAGCVTGAAIVDLVVPSPIQSGRVDPSSSGSDWSAEYGRDPHDIGHLPIRLWVEERGRLDVAAADGCPYFVAVTGSEPSQGRAHCTAWFVPDENRLLLYDSAGELIGEQPLPARIPILDWERWAWLSCAPILDALLVPIGIVTIVGMPYWLIVNPD